MRAFNLQKLSKQFFASSIVILSFSCCTMALDHDAVQRGGHAWVFDGYGKRPSDKHCFLHCNFGWAGKSDGWYYYKMFKKSNDESKKIIDEGMGERKRYFNWSWAYRVLIIK